MYLYFCEFLTDIFFFFFFFFLLRKTKKTRTRLVSLDWTPPPGSNVVRLADIHVSRDAGGKSRRHEAASVPERLTHIQRQEQYLSERRRQNDSALAA
jgi:hypothetical protein